MNEATQLLITKVLSAGLGGLMLFSVLYVTLPTAIRQVRVIIRKAMKYGFPAILFIAIFTGGMILHGGSKYNPTNNTPPQLQAQLPQSGGGHVASGAAGTVRPGLADIRFREPMWTGLISNALARIEKWYRRGAWNDGQVMHFDNDWCFPYGGDHLESVEIWSQGQIYPSEKSPGPIVSLVTPLSLKPAETEVFCGRTTNNSYRVEWRNAHPDRGAGQLADASIELCRNGNCLVTENGSTRVVPYDVPFGHNGFGQDDDWVLANFTNAVDILSAGYRNWAENQIGYGQLNGLYLFTASFPEDPPEATELYVGDYTVAVTNAGEYVFVLEKGTEYEFGTWPHDADVEYYARDDMSEDAPLLMSWWGYWDSYGTWTVDGGWNWLYYPETYLGDYYPGYCCWLPMLQGSPDVSHLGDDDLPMMFEALLVDYPENGRQPRFLWESADGNIRIMSPNARQTLVTAGSMPSWSVSDLSVTAMFDNYSLYSELIFHYGHYEEPQISLSVNTPEIIFLNDDGRTSRWYRVEVCMSCPVETNATISITHSGPTGAKFASDPHGANSLSLTDIQMGISSGHESSSYQFYYSCTNLGTGTFSAECSNSGVDSRSASRTYKVIEPLRKLISTETAPNGGYYNPCRLVYGTNAWLKVGVNGDFNASDVQWRVVSGPGRITATSGWAVSIEPTANSGEVVVEAAFGSDSEIQPRFVLPIVEKRRVSVSAHVAAVSNGRPIITQETIEQKLEIVNRVYSQAGIEFYLSEPVIFLTNSEFSVISEHYVGTNSTGRVYYYGTHHDVINLYALCNSTATIKLFWVDHIINGTPLAFTSSDLRSCFFAVNSRATSLVVPHEIGHALGLKDIYNYLKGRPSQRLPQGSLPLSENLFFDKAHDWPDSDGRGYYEISDTHSITIPKFLMNGYDVGGSDLPYSLVEGFSSSSQNITNVVKVKIGASNIRGD